MKNIGYKFYKENFENLKVSRDKGIPKFDGQAINDELFKINLEEIKAISKSPGKSFFKLKTNYPGLLIGSGYMHEIGGKEKDHKGEHLVKNELKLGFFFDYTTGLPCIPGSSVKGVLRHACTMDKGKYVKWIIQELALGIRQSKVKEEAGKINADVFLFSDTGRIKKDEPVFEASDFVKTVFEAPEKTSQYKRDIFFDAFPVSQGHKFLGSDFITPHKDPLKNPVPLQFMKVMPGVEFEFRFKLVESNGMSAEIKLELFRQILLDLGIGAKTNVGYGQLVSD